MLFSKTWPNFFKEDTNDETPKVSIQIWVCFQFLHDRGEKGKVRIPGCLHKILSVFLTVLLTPFSQDSYFPMFFSPSTVTIHKYARWFGTLFLFYSVIHLAHKQSEQAFFFRKVS